MLLLWIYVHRRRNCTQQIDEEQEEERPERNHQRDERHRWCWRLLWADFYGSRLTWRNPARQDCSESYKRINKLANTAESEIEKLEIEKVPRDVCATWLWMGWAGTPKSLHMLLGIESIWWDWSQIRHLVAFSSDRVLDREFFDPDQ